MGRSKTKSRILHIHLKAKAKKYEPMELARLQAKGRQMSVSMLLIFAAELSEKRLAEQKAAEEAQTGRPICDHLV
jgi:hypothetical protein